MSNVVSFAEESCFSGEQFRSVRRPVWFTASIYGQFNVDFSCDNGVWYDYSDDYLIYHLNLAKPDIEWGFYVYHRKLDQSEIQILHPDNNRRVGSIHVRRALPSILPGEKANLSGEIGCATVIPWSKVLAWKENRDSRISEGES